MFDPDYILACICFYIGIIIEPYLNGSQEKSLLFGVMNKIAYKLIAACACLI